MCGRYYVDDETIREIEELVFRIDADLYKNSRFMKKPERDLYQTNAASGRTDSNRLNTASGKTDSNRLDTASGRTDSNRLDTASGKADSNRLDTASGMIHTGDICPSQRAMVLTGKNGRLSADTMQWGFPKYQQKGLIINARAETAADKKIFRDSIFHRRCIIPAKHYYEWDSSKTKVSFWKKDTPVLFMAGFYQLFPDGRHFVILTTQANASVQCVHERMPLILSEGDIKKWICDAALTKSMLQKKPPLLERYQEYEQQTLQF